MNIKNVRIDARGIHGQVATAWTRHLDINRIMVIDDNAVKSDMQKIALKMACPQGVKLSVLSCEKAVSRLQDSEAYVEDSLMIIFLSLDMLEKVSLLGYQFEKVNIGNIPARPNTEQIRKTVYITADERNIIKEIIEKGTKVTAQMVPNDSIVDLSIIL